MSVMRGRASASLGSECTHPTRALRRDLATLRLAPRRGRYSWSLTWRPADRMTTCLLASECPRALGRRNLSPTDVFSYSVVEPWGVGRWLSTPLLSGPKC